MSFVSRQDPNTQARTRQRYVSDAASTRECQEPPDSAGNRDPPLELSEGYDPAAMVSSRFSHPDLSENKFLIFLSTKPVVICYSSKKITHPSLHEVNFKF